MIADVIQFNGDKDTRDMMSSAKFFEGYSRWDEKKNRYESWPEAVARVMNMHRKFYKEKMTPELEALVAEAEDAYRDKYVLGAQRALQFGGDQLIKHQMRLYNCTSSYADRTEFFGEFFYILLCGAGAGVSVQKHHVARLPGIHNRTKQAKIHQITDDIEGWATAADVLLSSYFVGGGRHPEYEGRRVYFDTSLVREKGAFISGGFKAPGPEPLRRALDKIEHLLQGLVLKGITTLSPIHVYDICMFLADAVLAGGVRRSATIFLFSIDDDEMMKAKTGNWFQDNPQRGRSNNSAVVIRNEITREKFAEIMKSVKEFGEPGFVFFENTEHCTNPCFTGDTRVAVADGRNSVTIEELAASGAYFPVYSARRRRNSGGAQGGAWVTEVKNARAFTTGVRPTMRVTLSDGTSFSCTDNHKLALSTGGYVEAKDSVGRELEGFFTKRHKKNYRLINSESNGFRYQHRMIWEYNYGEKPSEFHIDHLVPGAGDAVENLQLLAEGDHNHKTGQERLGGANPVHNIADRDSWHARMSRRSFTSNNPRWSGVTDEEILSAAYEVVDSGAFLSIDNLRAINPRIPKSFSKNRFGGSIRGLRDVIEGYTDYYLEPQIADEPIEIEEDFSYTNPTVVSVKLTGDVERVYDLDVDDNHNFYILTDGDFDHVNSSGVLVHNCVEIGMFPQLDGQSGWQGCNLTELNGAKANSKEEFFKACRAGAILGTLQAGYTNFKFVTETTRKIFEREALLGVSVTGWMNNPQVLLDAEVLREGAELVKTTNKMVAKLLGINPAARTTCVKPAGNASVLLQTASGVHGEHSPLYIRNVQMNKESEVAQLIRATNPYMVEESVWSATKSDVVISFPIIPPKTSVFRDSLYGVNLLEKIRIIQANWIESGTDVDLCVDPTVRHNVSNTVSILTAQAWEEVEQYLFDNRHAFAGVSLLSSSGDKDYNQAPNTEIMTEQEIIARFGRGAMFASGLIVDAIKGFDNLWDAIYTAQLDSDSGDRAKADARADWIRRYRKFAATYFGGDTKKAEYCLKAVHLLHKWVKIQENLKPIDFAFDLGRKEFTDINTTGAAACIGVNGEGGCAI